MERTLISLLKFWNGNQSLVKAFFLIFLPSIYIFDYLIRVAMRNGGVAPLLTILALLFMFLVYVFTNVSLWRCSANFKSKVGKVFMYLTRLLVVVLTIFWGWAIATLAVSLMA